MAYNIALNFEDGVSRFIECLEGEKVLDAAYRQKINLPMDCSDGVCGTCKCHCETGRYDMGEEYLEEALSEDECAAGKVLTCQMVPTSDCVISVPVSSQLCKTASQEFETTLLKVEMLSAATIELTLQSDPDSAPLFLSGQYVNIALPGSTLSRAYSFSSAPGSNELRFLIRNVPHGMMSSYLSKRAKPGDRLKLNGPQGSFYLREMTRPVLMLAGGTGLAPLLSMLSQLSQTPSPHPIRLIYGANTSDDLVKLDSLEHYATRLPDFDWCTCVADKETTHERKGYVTEWIDKDMLNAGDVDVYLCGPPPMVDAVLKFFHAEGVTPANFYYEKFLPQAVQEAS
jgi:benzoate/toluate 1,2-dioxygenase reductase subunit